MSAKILLTLLEIQGAPVHVKRYAFDDFGFDHLIPTPGSIARLAEMIRHCSSHCGRIRRPADLRGVCCCCCRGGCCSRLWGHLRNGGRSRRRLRRLRGLRDSSGFLCRKCCSRWRLFILATTDQKTARSQKDEIFHLSRLWNYRHEARSISLCQSRLVFPPTIHGHNPPFGRPAMSSIFRNSACPSL